MTNFRLQSTIGRRNEQKAIEKANRLEILLYNAIVLLQDGEYEHDRILDALGMTQTEYDKIMGGAK